MSDLIEKLSNLRSQYNCFDENERDAYHTLSEAIKVLSERLEPCEDAVSRKAVEDVLHGYFDGMLETDTCSPNDIYGLIELLPFVTPKRKTGKWITESLADDFAFVYSLKCSECGKYYGWEHNFCPNCGADMNPLPESYKPKEKNDACD